MHAIQRMFLSSSRFYHSAAIDREIAVSLAKAKSQYLPEERKGSIELRINEVAKAFQDAQEEGRTNLSHPMLVASLSSKKFTQAQHELREGDVIQNLAYFPKFCELSRNSPVIFHYNLSIQSIFLLQEQLLILSMSMREIASLIENTCGIQTK